MQISPSMSLPPLVSLSLQIAPMSPQVQISTPATGNQERKGVTLVATTYFDLTRGNQHDEPNQNTLTQRIFHPGLFNRPRSASLSDIPKPDN
ncbi:unnamed protein product [Leptosia nina]|uniref:Uncharacterized protein n=1 Tax=Leptosia nina TaxID=320188 RepID=A0AAV1JIK0_9NEOP